jgi:hypothetical protein
MTFPTKDCQEYEKPTFVQVATPAADLAPKSHFFIDLQALLTQTNFQTHDPAGPRQGHDLSKEFIMAVLTQTLTTWMVGFEALNAACAQVNANVSNLTWNTFANSTIGSQLPNPGNIVAFQKYLKAQFQNAGLSDWKVPQPIDCTRTFVVFMALPLWHTLSYSAMLYIQAFCPPACVDANTNLILTTPLSTAFPLGAADSGWTKLISGISTMKFDQVLKSGALTAAAALLTAPNKKLSDLITALSTT